MSFPLQIIAPAGEIFNNTVDAISAPGELGSFQVLTGHAPIVYALGQGVLKILTGQGEQYFAIDSGILEVSGNHHCQVLVDRIQSAEDFQKAKSIKFN